MTSELQKWKIINLSCFQLLNLRRLVREAMEHGTLLFLLFFPFVRDEETEKPKSSMSYPWSVSHH